MSAYFRNFLSLPMVLLFIAPLLTALALMLPDFAEPQAFADAFAHPQFWGGIFLSLWIAVKSTLASLVLAALLVAAGQQSKWLGAFLSVPHLAFAIGFAFLIQPTGLIARLLALPFGWDSPPQVVTTQDPLGLALIAALVLKETPFIIWVFQSLLQRDDLRQSFDGQTRVAQSLGHGSLSIWLRVLLPQLLPRMVWPLLAVFVYGATVVDMALVIGPTQPPTLATVIWRDINDAETAMNARGAALAIILTLVIALVAGLAKVILALLRNPLRRFIASGPSQQMLPSALPRVVFGVVLLVYVLVTVVLLLMSIAGQWPFPNLIPATLASRGWSGLIGTFWPLMTSFILALSTSVVALAACVAWMEGQSEQRDRFVLWGCGVALCLPALLIALGQYRSFLALGISGTWIALFFAHLLPVMAYVFVMLHGPYRAFDPRWQSVGDGLGAERMRFFMQVKWPMLKAPLLSSAAVGFGVSMVQFVPAQLAAAGRFSTLPMEAVTLASGSNRALLAAYAVALALLPLIAFGLAQFFGRARWRVA